MFCMQQLLRVTGAPRHQQLCCFHYSSDCTYGDCSEVFPLASHTPKSGLSKELIELRIYLIKHSFLLSGSSSRKKVCYRTKLHTTTKVHSKKKV